MLKEYAPKKSVLKAAQYTDDATGLALAGILAERSYIVEWKATCYKSVGETLTIRSNPVLSIAIDFEWKPVPLNSWVVFDAEGEFKLYTNEEFVKLYELKPGADDDAN